MGGGFAGWVVAAVLAVASVAAGAQPAHAPTLRAMRAIAPGSWVIRAVGDPSPPRASCVVDPAVFLRLRHRAAECTRFVIDDSAATLTVHYTCPGAGHVRTTVRVDTPRSLRIESEGIADGAPFSDSIVARRVGGCRPGA